MAQPKIIDIILRLVNNILMSNRPESIIIDNLEANKLLKNISVAKMLLPFFLTPVNLTKAAAELAIEPNRLYYWVKKFLNLNILTVTHKEKRAGSSIKYYATPAKTLILKADRGMCSIRDYFDHAISEYNEAVSEGIVESLLSLDQDIGIMMTSNGRGALQTRVALISKYGQAISIREELLKPNSPAAFTTWNHLRLKHQDAKELQAKMTILLEEYEQRASPHLKGYYVQMAIVPEVK